MRNLEIVVTAPNSVMRNLETIVTAPNSVMRNLSINTLYGCRI